MTLIESFFKRISTVFSVGEGFVNVNVMSFIQGLSLPSSINLWAKLMTGHRLPFHFEVHFRSTPFDRRNQGKRIFVFFLIQSPTDLKFYTTFLKAILRSLVHQHFKLCSQFTDCLATVHQPRDYCAIGWVTQAKPFRHLAPDNGP